jgi:molecular chaperone DnaK (HSP70)
MAELGIDFGTTNSLMVAYDKTKNEFTYFNFEGKKPVTTSSTVWYHDDKVVIGDNARNNINKFSNVDGHHFEKSIKLKLGSDKQIFIFGKPINTYEVAADIIKHLKLDAENLWKAEKSGVSLDKALFTVPVKFTGQQRRALRKAANIAGIEVTNFIHEPFASVVGYFFTHSNKTSYSEIIDELSLLEDKYILTFDWGGGTLDITVVKVENDKMIEVGTSELTGLAGDKFDEDIAWWAWNRFLEKNKKKYSSEYLEKIRKEKWDRMLAIAERCKIELSTEMSSEFLIESIIPGDIYIGIDENITRSDFEKMLITTVDGAINKVDEAIRISGIHDLNISKVFLIGGTSHIPYVQETLKKKFGHRVESVNNPELLIAQGAAVIAEMGWVPFLTKDIMVELSDNSYWEMFEKGTPVGLYNEAEVSEVFTCVDTRKKIAKVIICEGVNNNKHKNLGVLNVPTLGHRLFGDDIILEANIDYNIILTVKARSNLVHGYKQKEYHDIDEAYSISKIKEFTDLCFGLDFRK